MTKSDIDCKTTHFEYPELTRIHGEPTTQNLITLQQEIRANAITAHTTLGGGHPPITSMRGLASLPCLILQTAYTCLSQGEFLVLDS